MSVTFSSTKSDRFLLVNGPQGKFNIVATEFNGKRHEGVWNSRVLAFVPQQTVDKSGYRPHKRDTHFSDGTPVSSYEQFN